MKKLYIVTVIVLALAGCEDNSSSVVVNRGDFNKNIRMEQGKAYKIQKGDQIEKISENPQIKIDSNLTSGESSVTLLSGEASIIRGGSGE